MTADISIRANGKAEMAFVGDTPWHGLGQSVTKGASIGVWMKEAGMDWQAEKAEVLYRAVNAEPPTIRSVESHRTIYRSDTGDYLGIVGRDYKPVQPKECLEFFRDLVEHDGWHIHTAGVLRGGRKLWVMASFDEGSAVIVPKRFARKKGAGDVIRQNLLLATSLDGSMKTVALPTAVRVVCSNTFHQALSRAQEAVTVSHRTVFDAAAVKAALGFAGDTFAAFMAKAQEMSETPIDLGEAKEVLDRVFGVPEGRRQPKAEKPSLAWLGDLSKLEDALLQEQADDEPVARSTARVLELFSGAGRGSDNEASKGTRWGLFNAVTEHVDHEVGRTDDTRLDSAWFGRGSSLKQAAFRELAGVEE